MPKVPIEDRFWSKVIKTETCWLWTAHLHDGYGQFQVGVGRSAVAHRWAYASLTGATLEGITLRHTCDVRRCVNPAHLVPGTDLDNVRDRIARSPGHAKGEQHGRARLTQGQVDEMRKRKASGESVYSMHRDYGISYAHAKAIIRNHRWTMTPDRPRVTTGRPNPNAKPVVPPQ